MSEAAECFETWGGCSSTQPCVYPYINFPKCPLHCSLAQANLFATLAVYSVPVVNLWQCISRQLFRQSCFMVLLRQFLSSLRAENVLSEVADVTGIVKYICKSICKSSARPNFCLRGGGLWIPLPPCSATYAWVRVTALRVLVKFFLSCVLLS